MNIIQKPIKNFYERDGFKSSVLVYHTGEGSLKSIWGTISDPVSEKSYNYLLLENGDIWECVPPECAAWANGAKLNPSAKLIKALPADINPNKVTISIAFVGFHVIQDANLLQYEAAMNLTKKLSEDWKIQIDRDHQIGHYEIKQSKSCPGIISVDRIVFETNRAIEMAKRDIVVKIGLIQRLIEQLKALVAQWNQLRLGSINESHICSGGKNN